tara:strand:- start:541 stop:912 length:372 start_codon:yes stop_codon:yes gene_type:complete
MFIPEAGDELFGADPQSPSSNEEQQYLIGNHLTLLVRILQDAPTIHRGVPDIVDALDDILVRVDEYIRAQERERPWSWAARPAVSGPVRRVLAQVPGLRRLPRDEFLTIAPQLIDELETAIDP